MRTRTVSRGQAGISHFINIYVTQIDASSPAQKAGLHRGDIITRIGNTALDDNHPYINALNQHAPGETITLEVARDLKKIEVQVTLGESQ